MIRLLAVIALVFVGRGEARPSTEASHAPPLTSVSGHVGMVAPDPDPPGALGAYARRRPVPPQTPGIPGGVEDAFVYLEPLGEGAGPAPSDPVVIHQRDRVVLPHTSVARVGQVVEFPNGDDVFHNLFSLSPGNRFSLGRYAPGVTETAVFQSSGVVQLFCDIHAEMAGVILVVTTPYVARVGADGAYTVDDVPGGRYLAVAWHPAAGADSVRITVEDDAAVTQDFALTGSR